jgi:hypothetical protein
MKKEDIIYMAGFFDGEGHIRFNNNIIKRQNTKDSISYSIVIRIVNTNLPLLEHLKEIWGGHIYHRKIKGGRYKNAHDLVISNKDSVKKFIELVYPYSFIKKEQIDRALDSYKLVRGYDYFDI